MAAHLIRKLELYCKLSAGEKQALEHAASQKVRSVGPREDVILEGDPPRGVNLILDGFACRYKMLEDGRRQIVSFYVPGDLCNLSTFVLRQMDHSIASISAVKLAEIPREGVQQLTETSPRLARSFWWSVLVDEATSLEWTLNVGQRTAIERVAHLLCELFLRLQAVGLAEGNSCNMPLTQTELADATGLSSVHTNRVLQDLRRDRQITLHDRNLVIHDLQTLQRTALFNANYLHLDREGREFDATDC